MTLVDCQPRHRKAHSAVIVRRQRHIEHVDYAVMVDVAMRPWLNGLKVVSRLQGQVEDVYHAIAVGVSGANSRCGLGPNRKHQDEESEKQFQFRSAARPDTKGIASGPLNGSTTTNGVAQ